MLEEKKKVHGETLENGAKPSLFGLDNSNRDFDSPESWGKNQFNSSFPIALACYMHKTGREAEYIIRTRDGGISHQPLNFKTLFKVDPLKEDVVYHFETPYHPFDRFVVGGIPKNDVTIRNETGDYFSSYEIKLTTLPDNSTCKLSEERYSCELVVRPVTIIYLACTFCQLYERRMEELRTLLKPYQAILDWNDESTMLSYLDEMHFTIKKLMWLNPDGQVPLLLQPVWKTVGKSPILSDDCLDLFVWSNYSLLDLFMERKKGNRIARQDRTLVWLIRMLYDFAYKGKFDHKEITDTITFKSDNDKAFASSGIVTYPYLKSDALAHPRVRKDEIRKIILGDGQKFLSPERRLDYILTLSPELFE